MSLYLFASPYPLKAVDEFRQGGLEAFCMLCPDRRKVSRHAKRTETKVVVAIRGYSFVRDPDPWKLRSMRHIGHPVRDARGRWAVAPKRDEAWLINPPPGLFHDDNIPANLLPNVSAPNVKPGDVVRFTLANERHEMTALAVDAHSVLVKLSLFGREVQTKIKLDQIESVAA
jgi:transcription antitermination factor NusG